MNDRPGFDEFWGNPRLRDESRGLRVKGNLLSARPRYVRETYGEAALEQLIQATPEPARRHLLRAPLPFSWYSMDEMAEIDLRIVEGPMGGDVGQMKPFGATIASYDLPTIYKALFRFGTPAFVMKRIGIAYGMNIQGGSARAESIAAKEVSVIVEGPALPRYLCVYGICGWLEAAISMSGGERPRAVHEACRHEGAESEHWRVHWV